ncbi:unnamed protein product [Brugia timori]|uniref:PX domain-containing protein n=1 Tax=Brugia timori TaxID=42155 RepID=A0A0R3QXF1_9BILA|nr:unnamed protein product [Brugia timori]
MKSLGIHRKYFPGKMSNRKTESAPCAMLPGTSNLGIGNVIPSAPSPLVDADRHEISEVPHTGAYVIGINFDLLKFTIAGKIRERQYNRIQKVFEQLADIFSSEFGSHFKNLTLLSTTLHIHMFQASSVLNIFGRGFLAEPVLRDEEESYRYLMALDRY